MTPQGLFTNSRDNLASAKDNFSARRYNLARQNACYAIEMSFKALILFNFPETPEVDFKNRMGHDIDRILRYNSNFILGQLARDFPAHELLSEDEADDLDQFRALEEGQNLRNSIAALNSNLAYLPQRYWGPELRYAELEFTDSAIDNIEWLIEVAEGVIEWVGTKI